MITDTFRAMGTTVVVTAEDHDGIWGTAALFEHVEQLCSRFRPDSELSRINHAAGNRTPSAELAQAIAVADDLCQRTGGVVDPRLGASVVAWGYDRTFEEVGDLDAPRPAERRQLDLGGTAKGWTVDRAIEQGLAVVVNAGGDLRSADPRTVVHVDDPWGGVAATIELGVGALATSSTAFRSWNVGGQRVSHLIDPRTGAPTDSPIVQATALADTAAEAEAAAKAVLLLGDQGLDWARRTPWVKGALAVWRDGAVTC